MNRYKKNIILSVGTRGSPLALAQVQELSKCLKKNRVLVKLKPYIFTTHGDKDKKTPLTASVPDDIFTDTLDQAILNNEIDVALHSAKDLPQFLKPGLEIFALTKSVNETDAFVGKVPFKQLKKGAKVGTSSFIRQKAVKELNPNIEIISIRGTIGERIKLVEDGKCDGIIVATAALKRLGLEHLIKEVMPWEPAPLQGQLAVVGRSGDNELKKIFSAVDVRRTYGQVLLVGAGPGDPELITAKGIKALKNCDCVFYDYLAHPDLLKHAPKAEKIYVGKRKGSETMPQSQLSRQIRLKAMAGKKVVRLKGGDPLIFGRGADEINYLRSYHIQVDVIPGVSSATAIPSKLGIPLTARGVSSSVAFLSGHGEGERVISSAPIKIPKVETVVFLMGLTKLKEIVTALLNEGWKKTTPIVLISRGTWPDETILKSTLENILAEKDLDQISPPALIVAGEVVNFYKELSLAKPKTLYLGTNPEKYKSFGELIHFPMIDIRPIKIGGKEAGKIIKNIERADYVLLTSRFAVRQLFTLLKTKKEILEAKKFLTIGRETASALKENGVESDFVASDESSQGMFKELIKKFDFKNKKIFFPRSNLPNPFLEKELSRIGAKVSTVAIYKNVKPLKRELPSGRISKVIFTSPSTVHNFLKDYGTISKSWKILARGPLTLTALKQKGYSAENVNAVS